MKVAVVTGASKGIGRAIAEMLADEGYSLALGARSIEDLKKLAEGLETEVFYHYLDVSRPESVDDFAERPLSTSEELTCLLRTLALATSADLRRLGARTLRRCSR